MNAGRISKTVSYRVLGHALPPLPRGEGESFAISCVSGYDSSFAARYLLERETQRWRCHQIPSNNP